MKWLKQAVTGADNETFEGAYLALAAIIALTALTILFMLILAGVEIALCNRTLQKECFNPAGLGGGIAAAIASVGAFLGGVGAFIALDRRQEAPTASSTTTTTEREKITKVDGPAALPPAAIPDVDMMAAGPGVEPLPAVIGPEDAGKATALISKGGKRATRK